MIPHLVRPVFGLDSGSRITLLNPFREYVMSRGRNLIYGIFRGSLYCQVVHLTKDIQVPFIFDTRTLGEDYNIPHTRNSTITQTHS